MSDIRIQFTLSGADAAAFTELLVQCTSKLGKAIPCSRLAKEATMKYVHKQLADGRVAAHRPHNGRTGDARPLGSAQSHVPIRIILAGIPHEGCVRNIGRDK